METIIFKDRQGNEKKCTIDPEAGTIQFGTIPAKFSLAELNDFISTAPPRAFSLSLSELVFANMQLQSLYLFEAGEPCDFRGSMASEEDIWRIKYLMNFLNKLTAGQNESY